ncbi:YHYH domain-containing protein [Paucimonas lemoignei]|uniref:YHYH domain-containing protein n=1 Tax=Paucimonas lemoignei TaxID=29443 RepID=UPI001050E2D2
MGLFRKLLMMALSTLFGAAALAHPGGLNGEGCHTNRKTGEYHCHRGGQRSVPPRQVSDPTINNQSTVTPQQYTTQSRGLPPGCFVGPRGGTYTITKSGRKNYGGC